MNSRSLKECTALFGGAFDPPHLGHAQAIRGLLFDSPMVRALWVLPTGAPRFKDARVSSAHRLAMAKLAFEPIEPTRIKIDDREIKRTERTQSPTLTHETLTELGHELGRDIVFVLGTDQLMGLERWARFPELLGLSHWLVLARKGHPARLPEWLKSTGWSRPLDATQNMWSISPLGEKPRILQVIETPARELSSTEVREEIARTGTPPLGVLDPAVEHYLKQNGLYGSLPAHT